MAEQWTGHCETGAGIEKVNEKQIDAEWKMSANNH